jgi:S1-C subfamily serine protease
VESFAIPVGAAVSIADKIEAGQASSSVHIGATAFLGVQLLPGNGLPGSTGVTVAGVEPGLPAARAGLQPGDEITSVAGHQVSTPADVQSTLGARHPGNKISIGWLDQAGQAHTATVVLATGPVG